MWASKTGYWARPGGGPPTRSRAAANETSEPRTRPITVRGRSRDAGRPAHAAGAGADAPRVAERGGDDAIPLGDTPLVRAAPSADDPARRAADEGRRRALEPAQERLPRVAEGGGAPAPPPARRPGAGPGRRRVTPWSLASMRNRSASGSSRGERPPSPRNRRASAWRGGAAAVKNSLSVRSRSIVDPPAPAGESSCPGRAGS